MSPLIISPLIVSLPLLFCLAFHFTNATTTISTRTDTILPGQSLSTSYWIGSTGGSYYLGFFSPEKNSTKLYLVIYRWYLSYNDIVWVANREHPFPNSFAAVLTFNQDGNLVISNGSLLYVIANTSGGNVTYAKLLDTGNLILTNRASHILWQSFDHPTDTLFPGMKIKAGTTGWPLTSWQSDANPAPGLFSLQYLGSRKELVLMKGSQQYWSSPVLIDHLADIFVIDGDYLTWPSTNDIRRIRLDIYGNLLLQTYIYNWDDWEGDWFSFCLHYNNNISCTTTDTIRPGQSLNTSETIVSANGRYELGLFPSQEDYYYVGIRYYNFSGANVVVRNNPLLFPTVVWVANREDSFLTSSSILTLNPDLNLVISDGRLIYNLTNTSGGNDTYARLLDTGNLVLKNRASHILWQSIDYPTDTLLPGMKLKDAKTGWTLTSNRSIQDPAPGRFSLHYLGSQKELVVTEESEPYWISALSGDLADIFVIDGDYITWPSNYTSDITSIRLDVSGNFILQTRYDVRYWNSMTKLARADLAPKDPGFKNQLWKIIVPTASIAVVVTLGLFVYYVRRRKLRRKGEDLLLLDLDTTPNANKSEDGDSGNREVQMPLFSFASVSAVTDNFSPSNKLGEGGFGPVYKGILLKGEEVAVKRLSKRSGQGWEELKNEAMLIAKLQHKNLVRLLGCCIERDEKILIYEYMPNKSLDFFLFDEEKRKILDWGTRVGVIEGIAQGLLYLHQFSRLRIIHRDLKPSNILLDINMHPKISDFGMARIFGGNESQANTNRIVGTYGYMSPEYALKGLFSIKSDVFSFGVILLEIVSGKKNAEFYQSDCLHLIGYAWELWTNDMGSDLVDPLLNGISSMQMVLRYVNIALLCLQARAADRPTMSDVVAMLSNETTVLPYPKEPAFLNVSGMEMTNSVNSRPQICSLNGATVSIMEGG